MSDHKTTLRDAEKVLRLIGLPCPKNAQGADHDWHECPRCEMLHALEMRDSLARKLVLAGADALRRTCGTCVFWAPRSALRGICENHQAPACDSETVSDDGCIKGWSPKETDRG